MMKDFKANLKVFVNPSVPPCFCKTISVSYTMRPLVEVELDNLVDQGILTAVQNLMLIGQHCKFLKILS